MEHKVPDAEHSDISRLKEPNAAPVPPYWTKPESDSLTVVPTLHFSWFMRKKMQSMVRNTHCGTTCKLGPATDSASVSSVHRVQNPRLWNLHIKRVRSTTSWIGNKFDKPPSEVTVNTFRVDSKMSCCPLPPPNYVYLFHGTQKEHIGDICTNGLDPRFNTQSLYGSGVYLTDQFCKALQYAPPDSEGHCWVFYCRVLLGNAHTIVDKQDVSINEKCGRGANPRNCNSLVAKGGFTQHWATQVHNEFVVKDGFQCYPEFLLKVKRG
eukprot:TRINITY_DN94939_c0_g1_i1.p1 TRINITY_DN94939_c0_g1~~TRINITY_DN94939_c0_g1_i1.p1  ORF type:complete len:266 (+),score=16.30 TRINITY_DN94939_c0_g1_i1:36-833(+)